MFKIARPFFILVETPLHVGSGNDLGVIDLPVQREKHTGFPKVEASSLKGCMREAFNSLVLNEETPRVAALEERFPRLKGKRPNKDGETEYHYALELVFGPEKGDLHAGALGFTDARLLLFPVRSALGVFAWITCPGVIVKFIKELKLGEVKNLPCAPEANTVPENSGLLCKENKVILEEYTFSVEKSKTTGELAGWLAEKVFPKEMSYWQDKLKQNLVVLPDEDFRDFVNLSTEIITRIKINPDTGTVQTGALFNEEYIPQESIFYTLVLTSPVLIPEKQEKGIFASESKEEEAILEFWQRGVPEVLQLGGNATIGKGIVRIKVIEEGDNGNRRD